MALPILDGNQSATTLSTILSSGQHITAHTVVSLGTQAITDIVNATSAGLTNTQLRASAVTVGGTVTVGNSVTISSLPAISGTVTANVGLNVAQSLTGGVSETNPPSAVRIGWCSEENFNGVGVDNGGLPLPIQIYLGDTSNNRVTTANPLPISGTVTANPTGTQTIAGTVTANLGTIQVKNFNNVITSGYFKQAFDESLQVSGMGDDGAVLSQISSVFGLNLSSATGSLPISGTVTIGNTVTITGTVTANPTGTQTIAGSVTLGAGTAQIGSVTASISNSVTIASLPAISGTVTANSSNGSLTTRFGSVTTANTAFETSAVTNSNRKYLLIQNVTTASNVITVGIGFTPTTTQGIQLSSGAGLTFEGSYIPTGAVNLLSSVTASCFTILEA